MADLSYLDFTDEYMDNTFIGPQVARAIADVSFVTADMTSANTNAIYLIDETGYHGFNPNDGSIPQITGFEIGKSYLVNLKIDRDLTSVLDRPVPEQNNVLTDQDGNVLTDSDGNVLIFG